MRIGVRVWLRVWLDVEVRIRVVLVGVRAGVVVRVGLGFSGWGTERVRTRSSRRSTTRNPGQA